MEVEGQAPGHLPCTAASTIVSAVAPLQPTRSPTPTRPAPYPDAHLRGFSSLYRLVRSAPIPLAPSRSSIPSAGPVAEQVLLLENISTSIKIGPEQLPSVHKLLVEAVGVE